jgi:outer membrane lipoprotein-sorting protein
MKHLLTGLMATALLAPVASRADTVDEMIARHVAARGGAEALKAIHNLTFTGKLRPPGFDADLAYSETIVRGGKVRLNITLQGLTIVQSYDGAAGWQIQPFGGRKDPETLSQDDVKSLQEEADFEGGLVDYKAKGNEVVYLGTEDVDGAPAHALRVKLKNGDTQTWYLDPDAWLAVRVVTRTIQRGTESVTVTDLGDYEKVAGVYFPFEQESGPRGSNQRQRLVLSKVEANTTVDETQFVQPAAKAAASK